MITKYITWFQVNEYAEKVAQQIVSTLGHIPARIYPIQTVDGICASQAILLATRIHTLYPKAIIVDELQDANIVLDAVERNGKYVLDYPLHILMFGVLIQAEKEVEYIFPWNTIDPRTVRTNFPIRNTSARNTATYFIIDEEIK